MAAPTSNLCYSRPSRICITELALSCPPVQPYIRYLETFPLQPLEASFTMRSQEAKLHRSDRKRNLPGTHHAMPCTSWKDQHGTTGTTIGTMQGSKPRSLLRVPGAYRTADVQAGTYALMLYIVMGGGWWRYLICLTLKLNTTTEEEHFTTSLCGTEYLRTWCLVLCMGML